MYIYTQTFVENKAFNVRSRLLTGCQAWREASVVQGSAMPLPQPWKLARRAGYLRRSRSRPKRGISDARSRKRCPGSGEDRDEEVALLWRGERGANMSSLQVPELRLPAGDGGGGNNRGTAPLLLVPQSNVPRRRHSWICG